MFKVLKYNFKAAEFLAAGVLLDKSAYCVLVFYTFVFSWCSFVDNNENADILIVLFNCFFVFLFFTPLPTLVALMLNQATREARRFSEC